MARHPHQTTGYFRPLKPNTPPPTKGDLARIDRETAARDLELLERTQAARAKKPPHRHVYINSSCKVCGLSEVEST